VIRTTKKGELYEKKGGRKCARRKALRKRGAKLEELPPQEIKIFIRARE